MKMLKPLVPIALSLILLLAQSGCQQKTSSGSSTGVTAQPSSEPLSNDVDLSHSLGYSPADSVPENSALRSADDDEAVWEEIYSAISGEWVLVDSGIGIIQIKDELKIAALNVGEFNDLVDADIAQTCLSGGINDVTLNNCYSFAEGACPFWEGEPDEPQLWVKYYSDHYVVYVHPDCNHQEFFVGGEASN